MSRRKTKLSLEHLEERLLLDAVGPGEVALLNQGDTLYFVQGSTDPDDPSDLGFQNETVVIAHFTDPGNSSATAQFFDSAGNPVLENGDKIGDIVFTGTTEQAELYIWTGEFQEGFALGDIVAALQDRPDDIDDAFSITVPEGQVGADATYNTGRLIVQASGDDRDFYTFTATEGEEINVDSDGNLNVIIYRQYGDGPIESIGVNSAFLDNDFDADPAQPALDDVTIYLRVPVPGNHVPYTLEVDRVKTTMDATVGGTYLWTNDSNTAPVATHIDLSADFDGDEHFDAVVTAGTSILVYSGETGDLLRSFDVGTTLSSPIVAPLGGGGDLPEIIVGGADGHLYAYDFFADSMLHDIDLGSDASAGRPLALDIGGGDTTPEIVIATADGRLHAIDVTTGATVSEWTAGALSGVGTVAAPLVLANIGTDAVQDIVFANAQGEVWVVQTSDGTPHAGLPSFFHAIPGAPNVDTMVAVDSVNADASPDIVVAADNGYVYAINGATRSLLWSELIGASDIHGAPALADLNDDSLMDVIVADGDGFVHALNAVGGTPLWNTPYSSGGFAFLSDPVVSAAFRTTDTVPDIFVADADGSIHAIDGKDGLVLDTWDQYAPTLGAGVPINASPGFADLNDDTIPDLVYANDNGRVRAISGEAGTAFDYVPPEDLGNTTDTATDLTYNAGNQVGFGAVTPEFELHGEHLALTPYDYFTLSLQSGETIELTAFTNLADLNILSDNGALLQNLIDSDNDPTSYTNDGDNAQTIFLEVHSTGDWGATLDIEPRPLNDMVQLVTDDDDNYIWWNGATEPWMNRYTPDGADEPVNVFAPDGSGGAVVTGNIYFAPSATGFGTLGIDGSLKGSVGVPLFTLGPGETFHEIIVGFVNGYENLDGLPRGTTGGVYLDGNLGRFWSRTTVGQLEDAGADPVGEGNVFGPADFYVGGYFLDLATSGTIYANIEVGGQSTLENPTFSDDWEEYSTIGLINDDRESAMFASSPTGNFTLNGRTYLSLTGGDEDPQDWYAFVVEPGRDVTVDMTVGRSVHFTGAWVYDPTGRMVALVNSDEPYTFSPDMAGIYYINIGVAEPAEQDRLMIIGATGTYSVNVSGTQPVAFGSARAGNNLFGDADAAAEFGDDISDTSIVIGSSTQANAGAFIVGGSGLFADISLDISGDLGALYVPSNDSQDFDYMELNVGGSAWLLETTESDFMANYVTIGQHLGQLTSSGSLGFSRANLLSMGWQIPFTVGGHVGSAIAPEDFTLDFTLLGDGMDLLYVGRDYDGTLTGGDGADVGFAHVVGNIYTDRDAILGPVQVASGQTESFTDDGGAIINFSPVSSEFTDADDDGVDDGATLAYRYIPVEGPHGPVGAVITEIIASDSLSIRILNGQAHLGWITFGTGTVDDVTGEAASYLAVSSSDPLGELDLGWIMAGDSGTLDVGSIVNNTFHGDILSVIANNITNLYARGSIGITDRFASELGGILNPDTTTWAFPDLPAIFQETTVYAGGVFSTGVIESLRAGASIGDVHATDITYLRADNDQVINGQAFNFRGMSKDAFTWDGLAGTVYASNHIGYLDPGSGFFGGPGSEPIGGVFVGEALGEGAGAVLTPDEDTNIIPGTLQTLYASDALIEGPIFAGAHLETIRGVRTVFHESRISVGGDAVDWAWWDDEFVTTDQTRLNTISLTGAGSRFDRSWITTGVLDTFVMGANTLGYTDSTIYAVGDSQTQEGVNTFLIRGGGVDGTNLAISAPPFTMAGRYAIESLQRIGNVTVLGGNMRNAGLSSQRSINNIFVLNDIVADGAFRTQFIAPLGINSIRASNIDGAGSGFYVGTARLGYLNVINDITNERTTVDGPLVVGRIGGRLNGTLEAIGPHGRIEYLSIGRGVNDGNVIASNYIGTLDVLTGDVDGRIQAGGSNTSDTAIGVVRIYNGDLMGDATGTALQVTANPVTVRPGGGLGFLYVNGNVWGDIELTSNYKAASQNATTAHARNIRIVNGGLFGDFTIQKNNPADPNDPGGDLLSLTVVNPNQTAIAGNVNVDGHIGNIISYGHVVGNISSTDGLDLLRIASRLDGNVAIQGNAGLIYVFGDVNGTISTAANAATGEGGDVRRIAVIGGRVVAIGGPAIDLSGDLDLLTVTGYRGPFADVISGDIELDGLLGTFIFNGGAFNGNLEAGAINRAFWLGTGLNGTVTTTGGGGTQGQLNYLYVTGDSNGIIDVAGDGGRFFFVGGRLQTSAAGTPVINIEGDLAGLYVINYRGANPVVLEGNVVVDGTLNLALIRNGNFDGTLTAGAMNTVYYYTDNGIQRAVTTTNGGINYLSSLFGPVNAPVSSASNIGTLLAYQGVSAPVTAANNFNALISYGAVTADITVQAGNLNVLRVVNTGGNAVTGNVDVQAGRLNNAALYGHVTSTIAAHAGVGSYYQVGTFSGVMDIDAGNLNRMTVINRGGVALNQADIGVSGRLSYLTTVGNVLGSDIDAGRADYTTVVGNFTDSDLTATQLTRVRVTNTIQDTGGAGNEIRATDAAGSFVVSDTTGTAVVTAANSPLNFGGTMVRVG